MEITTSSGEYKFRPRAKLIRTIGEELISSDVVAIIELVKNSYDANSSIVEINIGGNVSVAEVKDMKDKITPLLLIEKSSCIISILDDGGGMSLDILENAWMQPATDFKKKATNKLRRFTGEKGIGRFASAKLADSLTLITKEVDALEIVSEFNWADFSNGSLFLEDISIPWVQRKAEVITGKSGTKLILENIRSDWDENKIRELRTALSRLLSPLSPVEDFLIELNLPPGLEHLSGLIDKPDTVNRPDYIIKGNISEDGLPHLLYYSKKKNIFEEVLVDINEFCLKDPLRRKSQAGPLEFEFRVWNREADSLNILASELDRPLKNVRQDLNELAGVSIYRDNFRVLPYGNKDNDWLGLNRKRVNNPTMRLSSNQIIGYISISLDANPNLKDQSNREGLVQDQAYFDLVEYISLVIKELEERRYIERPREADKDRKSIYDKFSLNELVAYLKTNHPGDKVVLELLSEKEKEFKEGLDELQGALSRYRRLSTLGFMVDTILHDGGNLLNKIDFCSKIIAKEVAKTTVNIDTVKRKNDEISYHKAEFSNFFKRIEPFGGRKRGRPKSFVIEETIKNQVLLHQTQLRNSHIEVILPNTTNTVRIDESELGIVLMNLLQNSMYWLLEVPENDRFIRIDVEKQAEELSIIFSDSGPGIKESYYDAIFDPYFSTKNDGIGLGLTIVGEIISEYNGSFSLIKDGPLSGATFKITFKYRI